MSQPLTLQSLSIELDEWRKNRTKQGRLPTDIWTKTLKLLESHSMTEVSRELRISHEQIRNKLNHQDVQKVVPSTPFVEMKSPSIKHEKIDITLSNRIELKRADGASMIIEHLSDSTLSTLLAKFMRDL
ncbi:MAG: hypothetical protein HON32_06310 [Francisellaceae bacterium]|jgi:hypothetical protein|nr:hypothetical protein [Francisellaceae bacterium]MBT6539013.1 hypothetical protein [Francisellaceae bacterium]